ncbi:MAG: exopolysaccharide biosynthesis protein [Pseudomonadota bacterium]
MSNQAVSSHPPTLLESIEALAVDAQEDGFSLAEIMDRLDERAFGAMLFVLALPCCIPFLYGVPQVVSLPMMAIAAQMAWGREEPWLPGALARRRVNREGLSSTAKGGKKWFGWVERIARPRLTFLTGRGPERAIGVLLCLFCASILVPLPMTNTTPGFAVALVAFGLMERDGLLVLVGLVIGTLWIAALVAAFTWLASLGMDLTSDNIKTLLGLGETAAQEGLPTPQPPLQD